jgi:hypothetical protein
LGIVKNSLAVRVRRAPPAPPALFHFDLEREFLPIAFNEQSQFGTGFGFSHAPGEIIRVRDRRVVDAEHDVAQTKPGLCGRAAFIDTFQAAAFRGIDCGDADGGP